MTWRSRHRYSITKRQCWAARSSHAHTASLSTWTMRAVARIEFPSANARRCSSANTLRIQRLEFGCEQLTKGPNVISQTCCHRWCALSPAGLNRAAACTLVRWQRLPQAHVRSSHIVEALEKDDPLPHALAVFTEAGRLTRQWGQGLTQGQVYPFDQGRADREAQW